MSLQTALLWCISLFALVISLSTVYQLATFISAQETDNKILNHISQSHDRDAYFYPALWNSFLLGLFILQHSGMATMWWKERLADLNLYTASRSIYVILTCCALQYLMYQWAPLPTKTALWFIDTKDRPGLWMFFFLVHLIAWVLIYFTTLLMDFTELIGMKQVYYEQKGKNIPILYKKQEEQKLYKHMRHPGTTCFLIILWLHPMMTLQRLFLAIAWTLYVLFGFSVTNNDYLYVKRQIVYKRYEVHID